MSRVYFHTRDDDDVVLHGTERHYCRLMCEELTRSVLRARGHPGDLLSLDGRLESSFYLVLNTALAVGNDVVKLMARLHGQCEIHAYVEGPHRAWLADIIERGRETRLLRVGQGWEGVVDLLRRRDDEPVVTSYSVSGYFPRPELAGAHSDEAIEAWAQLPWEAKWDRCMAQLRAERGLQWSPDSFAFGSFGSGLTAID